MCDSFMPVDTKPVQFSSPKQSSSNHEPATSIHKPIWKASATFFQLFFD